MANNIDLNTLLSDLRAINTEFAKTATLMGNVLKASSKANEQITAAKNLKTSQNALNTSKQKSNEIEKLGNTLLAQRNKAVAAQSTTVRKLTLDTIKQKEALKAQNAQLRDQAKASLGIKKSSGYFKTMTKSILAAGTAMLGITAVFRVLKNAGTLVRDFQKENAVLAGVLNQTREESVLLTENAKLLGSTTAKTASEITSLQIAYARLGFSQEEILNLTSDTINGSIALNAELSDTAELTGAVVRSFDEFSSTDASEILDIMTASTQKTALNFSKLQSAIPTVAGAAAAAKVPFTTMIAQLGQAADRGLDASTAATSLRNIYLELAKKGLTLDEALKKINTSQDKLSTANELFGKRAAVTALALANTTEKTAALDIELNKAGGTAKKVAEEQLATLDGSIKLLTSAWEGFILSIEDGDGVIGNFVNGTLKKFADMLTTLSNLDLVFTRDSKLTIDQISRTYDVLNAMNNKTGASFRKFVDEYEDSNSRWLQDNKATVIQFLDDLGFSNTEAEALYKEHLARRITSELNSIDVTLNATKKGNQELIKEAESVAETLSSLKDIEDAEDPEIDNYNAVAELAKRELADKKEASDAKKAIDDDYASFLTDLVDNKEAEILSSADMEIATAEYVAEKKIELLKSIADQEWEIASSAGNSLFDLAQSRMDSELEALEVYYDAKIEAADGNDDLQTELAEEYAAKDLELRQKQAQSEKNQELFNLAITTAKSAFEIKATAAVLTADPLTAAFAPLAYAQLGLLLTSSAIAGVAIASEPLPAYFTGVESAPAGLASVAEMGRELGEKNGKFTLYDSPQIANLEQGTKIYNNRDTEQMLNAAIYKDIAINGNEGIENRMDSMISEVRKLKQVNVNLDANGFSMFAQKGNSKVGYLNRKGRK